MKDVYEKLAAEYSDAKISLDYGNEFQLLVAVILSAQCTDKRVNLVTPALFDRYPEAATFAEADIEELKKLIYSTGFYNNKAKNIIGAAKMVMEEFKGELPRKMDEILRLPGVARKTANVVLSEAFGVVEGIVVDTHVMRVSGRLGLISKKLAEKRDAVAIEKALMKVVPKKYWKIFPHLMIFHGRKICIARNRICERCVLNKDCPSSQI